MELRVLGAEGRYLRRPVAAVPEPELALEIPDPRPVDGWVFDRESREPLAAALVWAYGRESGTVRTDAEGRFRIFTFEGVPIYSAGAPGYKAERGGADKAEAGLGLQPIRAIVGRVVDRRGVGVGGAEVVAEPDVLGARSSMRLMELMRSTSRDFTDAEGRFRLHGLLADARYDVEARCSGYAEASKRVAFAPDEPGERRVELVLDAGRVGVGRVVDGSDRPVVGAEVGLYEPPGEMPMVRIGPPEPRSVSRAVTDAAGEFRLADLGEGSFYLEVAADGFAPLTVPGVEIGPPPAAAAAGAAAEIDLGVAVLVEGAEIHGRVVDAGDEPVAGAEIFTERPAGFFSEGLPSLPEAVSDAEGRFVIGGLTPGVARRVVARAEGFIEGELLGAMPGAAEEESSEVVLVLHGPSTIRGRLLGPDSEPVRGALISSGLLRDTGSGSSLRSLSGGLSDGSGAFELTDPPPGRIQLRIRAEGYRDSEGHLIPVPPGEDVHDVVIQLETGAVLAGRVVDADGHPVPGASISSHRPERGQAGRGPSTRSGADGTFRLEGMPPGESRLTVRHERHGMATETVDLELGREAFLEIRLAGASVSGQVVTLDGELAASATVGLRAVQDGETARRNEMEVVARSDGTFEIDGIPDGTWRVFAEHPEHGTARSEELEAAGAPIADLYLELQPYVELTGEIRGLDFERLAETKVAAFSRLGHRVGEVRQDGTYRVGRLSPESWSVMADAGDRQVSASVTLEPGSPAQTLDLDFGGGRSLEGVVLLDGAPADGAAVTCVDAGQTERVARTDHLGRFRIEGLAGGTAQLLVTHLRSSLRYRTTVQLPRVEPLRLDVRTSSIFGRAVDTAGIPLAAVTISLEEVEPESAGDDPDLLRRMLDARPAVTDARGGFRFGGLTEGTWRLRAEKEGFEPSERDLTLQAGADLGPLTFVLNRAEP